MNTFQRIMVLTMVTTGALNTITASLQLARPALNTVGVYAYFDHYFVQTLFMMLGECLCMVAYLILKYVVYRKTPEVIDGENPIPMNPLVLWPAAFLDIVGTSCDYMGLGFMRNPGFFQMLRCSPIIFCGLLSIPFLGQRLKMHNWMGIITVCFGLIIKAIPDAAAGFLTHDDLPHVLPEDPIDWKSCASYLSPNATINVNVRNSTDDGLAEGSSNDSSQMLIGILIVLVGEFFHGCQFVYEEKFLGKYNLPPLKCVGLEGINGALTLFVILWPMYFIDMGADFGLGPHYKFEDMIDGLKMIFDGGPENGGWLLAWTFGNMCSIAVFNFAGITVTRELSATTRAVLDQIRIIVIWAIFLIPLGPFLCRLQDHFQFTAPIGLFILICGVFIYNDIIIMPLVRKYVLKKNPEPVSEKDLEMPRIATDEK